MSMYKLLVPVATTAALLLGLDTAEAGVKVRAPRGVLVVVDWSGAGPLVTVDVKKKRRATVSRVTVK
jgi:hypothetical protein